MEMSIGSLVDVQSGDKHFGVIRLQMYLKPLGLGGIAWGRGGGGGG